MPCERGICRRGVSVCLARCSTEMVKRRIMQRTPHNSPGSLVFGCRRYRQNSNGVTPTEAPNACGVENVDHRKRCQLSSVASLSHWASTFHCSTFAVMQRVADTCSYHATICSEYTCWKKIEKIAVSRERFGRSTPNFAQFRTLTLWTVRTVTNTSL